MEFMSGGSLSHILFTKKVPLTCLGTEALLAWSWCFEKLGYVQVTEGMTKKLRASLALRVNPKTLNPKT